VVDLGLGEEGYTNEALHEGQMAEMRNVVLCRSERRCCHRRDRGNFDQTE
jgi:hypothetical protein